VADATKLPNPTITVHMDDGSVLTVQTLNRDLLNWDRTRAARKWPTAEETPSVWITYLAWAALTREGQIPKMTLNEFEDKALSAQPNGPEDGGDGVGPTHEGAEPSS
jgi:hypothetical protein